MPRGTYYMTFTSLESERNFKRMVRALKLPKHVTCFQFNLQGLEVDRIYMPAKWWNYFVNCALTEHKRRMKKQ